MDPPHPTRVLLLDSGLEGLDANNETTVDGDPAAAAAHPEPSATTAPAVDNGGGGGGYLAVATEPAPSGDSSDDELPAYDNVADVKDNEVEFMLDVRGLYDISLLVGVASVDSIAQVKAKIYSVQMDVPTDVQLLRDSRGRFLPDTTSVWNAGLRPDSKVSLFIKFPDGSVNGPGETGEHVTMSVETALLQTMPDEHRQAPQASPALAPVPVPGAAQPAGAADTHDAVTDTIISIATASSQGPAAASNAAGAAGVATQPRRSETDEDHTDSSDDELPPTYSHIDQATRDLATPAQEREFENGRVPLRLKIIVIFIYIIFISVCVGLPLALTIVGFVHYDDCPQQPRIPLWMVVMGLTVMVWHVAMRYATRCRAIIEKNIRMTIGGLDYRQLTARIDEQFNIRHRRLNQILGLLQGFSVIWFIVGSIWVFSCGDCRRSMDEPSEQCHKPTYNLAFYFLIVIYVLSALPFVWLACMHVLFFWCAPDDRR